MGYGREFVIDERLLAYVTGRTAGHAWLNPRLARGVEAANRQH